MMKRNKFVYLLLTLLLIPAAFFLLIPGFYEPHDLHHFADIYEMYRAISSGQIPPRLGPDFIFGYGYPLFNFYYVLPFYIGSFFYAVLGSLQISFKLVFVASIILSVFGMFFFLREFFGKWAAFTGSVLFLYTPYRAVQIYVRGAMGEALALSLLPFVLWSAVRLIKQPGKRVLVAILSFISALFILSHNYFWVISLPFILVLLTLLIDKENLALTIRSLLTTFLLSIGLTSYWWLPALIEQGTVSSTTPFPLIDHFPFIKQLIIPSWGYGSSVWGSGDGMSFQVGVINWFVFLILIGMILFKRLVSNKQISKLAIWSITGFLVSLFMMNIRSYPLWKILPFHDFIQFPWRLLFLTTLFTSVMAAVSVEVLNKRGKYLASTIILGSLLLTFHYFQPSKIFYHTDDDYLSRFFANRTTQGEKREVSKEYLNYSEDYLLLPKWVDQRPRSLPHQKIESDVISVFDIEEITPVKWVVFVETKENSKVTFNSLYFPGWFAKIDGNPTLITLEKPLGLIETQVPLGKHEISFYWAETPLRKMADLISLFSLGINGFLFWNEKKEHNRK
ncbi:MAG: hypothetical protein UT19_C0004G0019 [Candidatus Woesebacteria bacterium GW2011_GWB1_39_10b]|uniref:Membrane protein 6-pyruvoyl-tetrahydropterin synthase-related domain-containing protein n=3 Tax=Candidatus Woeseibacteriota TaxID=1752722 RepID=A0A0G0NHZ7_9BACT|nr:MAG: hypothetical protein US72_C0010G0046 [Microgenomates group bacterium GW2011_GWC1_38_12]KKQ94058.1 MAG: hypothetical protein UT19_C0004G0019 [Candidatus Woesebacteria bacterium GW2011_GWB1_39_10b]KKR12451.1 MAG: hypothetical protein UT40_C0026G0012 [Candidatus Woesebacteria bacterium GW2011_GWA1_39_21b]